MQKQGHKFELFGVVVQIARSSKVRLRLNIISDFSIHCPRRSMTHKFQILSLCELQHYMIKPVKCNMKKIIFISKRWSDGRTYHLDFLRH